jgi:Na+/H+-dicarboxylate symporter
MGLKTALFSRSLTFWIFLSLILGTCAGVLIHQLAGAEWYASSFAKNIFQFGAEAFLRLLKFIVVPVVLVSLTCGVAGLQNIREFGKIAGKTFLIYLATTLMAIALAMSAGFLTQPGVGFNLGQIAAQPTTPQAPSLVDTFLNIIPVNLFSALSSAEMLQVIFIALLLGLALSLSGERGRRVLSIFEDANSVIMKIVEMVMWVSPLGVFCLTARVFAAQGFEAFHPLIVYFLTVLGVLLVHQFIFYSILLRLLSGLSPLQFFRKFRPAMLFAFSTSSSNATIPVTLKTVESNLGVSNRVASFTIPLGATVNMDGTAIMQGVATMFIAQAAGIDLGWMEVLTVLATATLASIGTAGVPSVGLVTLAMVLQSVNLPLEGIAVILAVDRLLDMARTVVNVTGDAVTTCIVAKSEGLLDSKIFKSPN